MTDLGHNRESPDSDHTTPANREAVGESLIDHPSLDPYAILGVAAEARDSQVLLAYERARREGVHPPELLRRAFEQLIDPWRRAELDLFHPSPEIDAGRLAEFIAQVARGDLFPSETEPLPIMPALVDLPAADRADYYLETPGCPLRLIENGPDTDDLADLPPVPLVLDGPK